MQYSPETLSKIKEYKQNYQYYPDIKEPDFYKEISHKREFAINYIKSARKDINDACNRDYFELAPHQIFLKQWISPLTPYKSLLIFHGVGVGKTCSGIQIAENFKDHTKDKNKRIIVLASQNIQVGWRSTIYNPVRGDNQCTGDNYEIPQALSDKPIHDLEKSVNRQIKSFYELYGYTSFANRVKRAIKKKIGIFRPEDLDDPEILKQVKDVIRSNYSDRTLIIDEVHNIRSGSESEVRETLFFIELVITYSHNMKLILLTANPMFNQPSEILWILNLLRLNDDRPILSSEKIFEGGDLTSRGERIIRDASRGYISYLRGENPISFPLRIYPSHNPDKIYDHDLKCVKLFSSELSALQRDIYHETHQSYLTEADTLENQQEHQLLQLGNMVYPSASSDEVRDSYGEQGLERCFSKTVVQGLPTFRYRESIARDYGEFFDIDIIGDYSCKIKTILDEIANTDGIIFIYSNWVYSGIIPLMLALEQNGYRKYKSNELLRSDHKREPLSYDGIPKSKVKSGFKQATYMMITGDSSGFSRNFEQEMKVVTSPENKDGSLIKIILGSRVASEGLDFKNIRSIHILEPWHNLNRLEQVVGRGVRNCSHLSLSENLRNTTLYYHTIQDKDSDYDPIDIRLYKRSETKAIQIGNVETILRNNAIDQYLFQNMNHLTKYDVDPVRVTPAFRGAKSYLYSPYDRPYTRVSLYQAKCEKIKRDISMERFKDWNFDTYDPLSVEGLLEVYQKRILYLIASETILDSRTLSKRISEYQEVYPEILDEAIFQVIRDSQTFLNQSGDSGHVIASGYYLIFQPTFSNDPLLPLYYRSNRGSYAPPPLTLSKIAPNTSSILTHYDYNPETMQQFFKMLDDYSLNQYESRVFDLFRIDDTIKYAYLLRRCSYKSQLDALLSYFRNLIIKDKEHPAINKALDHHFRDHLIYSDKEEERFSLKQSSQINQLFGAMIYHHKDKKIYIYEYRDQSLHIANQIITRDIIDQIKYKPRFSMIQDDWGFMMFSERYRFKQAGIICKLVVAKDQRKKKYSYPPGPGAIIRDTNRNEGRLLSTDPFALLDKSFGDLLRDLSRQDYDKFKEDNQRQQYAVYFEIVLDLRDHLLSPEHMHLIYHK